MVQKALNTVFTSSLIITISNNLTYHSLNTYQLISSLSAITASRNLAFCEASNFILQKVYKVPCCLQVSIAVSDIPPSRLIHLVNWCMIPIQLSSTNASSVSESKPV